ncbi:MAG: C40 family peptidase, partial [Candidatus Adiutrix sp.]|nr:C40 family peptidase [Candidatus Adiutrix sp.]
MPALRRFVEVASGRRQAEMKKIIFAVALLAAALAVCGCSASLMNLADLSHTQTKVLDNEVLNNEDIAPRIVGSDVIDPDSFTRGLSGSLVTGRAGQGLLAEHGLADDDYFDSSSSDSGYIEPQLAASASLSLKSGVTGSLLTAAYGQSGRPYKDGGQTPAAGFDAAGFTRWVYSQGGVSLPRDVKRQAAGGRQIAREDLRPGDLLIYRDASVRDSFHVGIYTGQGNFLHAAPKAGVVTETAAFGPQFSPYFAGGRRYYDDPEAAPLSEEQKMAAASSAVKIALAGLGPDDKPARANYSRPKA